MTIHDETNNYRSISFTDSKKRSEDNSVEQINTHKQLLDECKEKINDLLDPTKGMSDEEKSSYEEKINQKIKIGAKLSASEMRYLQIKSPYLYAMISRVQMRRKVLEERLKCCRSKKEVEEAYNDAILHIGKKDPAKGPLIAAYDNVTKEFKKCSQYRALPQITEDEKKEDKLPIFDSSMKDKSDIESKYIWTENECPIVNFIV